MAEEDLTGKSEGGGSGDDKPETAPVPGCTVFVQGRCDGTTCNCAASGGGQ